MMTLDPDIKLGFGCDPLGGHNWGAVDPQEVMAAIPLALDMGVQFFDTADCYGNGASEERLRTALGTRRSEAIIGSKFGVRIGSDGKVVIDNDPAWIRKALEGSLRRLGTDQIDLYQLHWWDETTPLVDVLGTLEDLRQEGKIAAYGATNVNTRLLIQAIEATQVPSFASYSCEFSLVFAQRRGEIDQLCAPLGAPSFLSWGSLGGGMLSGKYTSADQLDPNDRRLKRPDSHFAGDGLAHSKRIIEVLGDIAAAHGTWVRPAHVALAWIRASLGYGVCLAGVKSRAQLRDLLPAFALQLTTAQVASLDQLASKRSAT